MGVSKEAYFISYVCRNIHRAPNIAQLQTKVTLRVLVCGLAMDLLPPLGRISYYNITLGDVTMKKMLNNICILAFTLRRQCAKLFSLCWDHYTFDFTYLLFL